MLLPLQTNPPTAFFNGGGPKSAEQLAHRAFHVPALPLEEVVDPTGAGDSFAGGFFGYLASQPELTPTSYRHAMFYGSVMGSFAVERFGTFHAKRSIAASSSSVS